MRMEAQSRRFSRWRNVLQTYSRRQALMWFAVRQTKRRKSKLSEGREAYNSPTKVLMSQDRKERRREQDETET